MSEVLDDNLEKEENSNGFQLDFEEITPWNGANDTGKDVRMKWLRNFEKIRQNFELLSGLWSLKIDSDGKKYAYTNFPIVGAAGMTLFAGEEIKVDSIFKGLPLDTTTLQWVDGVLTVVGGTGGGEAGFVKWQNIEGKPSWITTEKPKYSYTEITGLVEELGKYVTLSTEQSVTGMKDFANGMKVSGVLFKVINGVLTLDCSIAVTGGITTHAIGEQTTATIMDGIAVDGITITKEDGVLKVVGGGGASNWDELEGKPSWITDIKPVYTWGEITQKPTTLSGYGIQASDVLNVLKTVDGSGSGLDADTLDGKHLSSTKSLFNGIAYIAGDGVMEIGRYLDFHYDSTDTSDYSTRLSISSKGHSNDVYLPIQTGTLALTTDNVASATKLQTARTIWGQSFDGTANVTGSLTSVTNITGTGTFTGANIKATDSVYVNGIRLHKTADGVITLEGNLAVTGGITQFAVNEVSPSTIMDGVVVDGTSIKKENGVLKVMNAGGGEAGSVKWTNINGKPTTLTGYGISASDVLSTLKTVDGSGSGLDADLLDGVHNGEVTAKKINYDNSANGVNCVQFMQMRTQNDAGDLPSSNWYTVIKMNHDNGDTYYNRTLAFDFFSDKIYTRRREKGIAESWRTIAFIDDNVASATKLTTNAGTATRPVYFANGIPVAGTYTFGNANGNAAINNGTLCTNLNADMLDGVHNGNLTAAYTHNGDISASLTVTKNDNNGYPVYILIADCTDTINASSGGLHHGFTGIIIESRISGYAYECVSKVIARVGYNDYNMRLTSDNDRIIPYILKNNSKYYIALKVFGSAHQLYFYGFKKNLLSSFIQVNTTDSSGTLPSGYSIEYSGTAMGVYGNASSATKLQTARKIWGQSFDGTKDITGSLNYVDSISAQNIELKFSTPFIDFHYNYSTKDYTSRIIEDGEGRLSINNSLFVKMSDYVGIGTASPSEKLHVNGNLLITGKITSYDYIYADGWFQANSITTGLYNKAGDTRWYGTSNGWVSDKSITVNGNLLVTGGGTFYSSDIRAKIIIERPKLSLNSIANAPVIKFRWNGYNGLKDDNKQHVGGIAQYIEKILPECVIGQKDDFLSFDYATTGYIFSVLTARHLLSYETRTDRIIRKLKERIKRLERQLNIENHEEVCIVAD